MRSRVLAAAALICGSLSVGATGTASADALKPGRVSFDAINGRVIVIPVTEDGRMQVRFNGDGKARVTTGALPDFDAMWWVNPAGQICMVAEPMWNGGRCYEPLSDESKHLKAMRDASGGVPIPVVVK